MNSKHFLSNSAAGLITGIVSIGLLSGCGNQFQTSGIANPASTQGISAVQGEAVSSKILRDVSLGLGQDPLAANPLALSQAQITALVNTAMAALQSKGLAGTTDLHSVLPTLVQSLTQAVGSLPQAGAAPQKADLIGKIGQLVLGSVGQLNGSVPSADLVQLVSQALFQGLPMSGISTGSLSQSAGTIMSGLVSHLGQQGLSSPLLATLMQSLTSGAALGIGNLNLAGLSSTVTSDILHQIGVGSTQGLSRLSQVAGSNTLLQTLIESVVAGAQVGLSKGVATQPGAAIDVKQLLASLISGQTSAMQASNLPSSKQQAVSALLAVLLSRI